MTEPEKPPSIGERYGLAATNGSTGAEVLAAGLQRHRLGALLLRLQAEYDTVRHDLERAGQIPAQNREEATTLERAAAAEESAAALNLRMAREAAEGYDDASAQHHRLRAEALQMRAADIRERAAAIRKRAPADIVAARAFILLELRTLREAKQQIGGLALGMTLKRGCRVSREAALKLAGRALDIFLDPICHECDGTGNLGSGYVGTTEKRCRVCSGFGLRRDILGNSMHETNFAAVLLGELDRASKAAARGIARAMGPMTESEADPEAVRALGERLTDLRSPEAEGECAPKSVSATIAPEHAATPR